MTRQRIRFGLYGCNMYRTRDLVAGAAAARPDALEIAACYDVVRDKVDAAVAKYGGKPCYTEAEFLKADMDVVLVSLPPYLHPAAFEACAKAGFDVYLEKPVCVDEAGKERLLAAHKANPVQCYVGLSYRFVAPFRKTAEVIRRPGSGRVLGWHHHWRSGGGPPPPPEQWNWRHRVEQGGGQIVNHCCHWFDLMEWAGGPVKQVSAVSYTAPDYTFQFEEQELTATFVYEHGGIAVFDLSQSSRQNIQVGTVHCENVAATYEWGQNTHVKVWQDRPRAAEETFEWSLTDRLDDGGELSRNALQMNDFMTAWLDRRPMPCTLTDGLRVFDLACAIRESARQDGAPVNVSRP